MARYPCPFGLQGETITQGLLIETYHFPEFDVIKRLKIFLLRQPVAVQNGFNPTNVRHWLVNFVESLVLELAGVVTRRKRDKLFVGYFVFAQVKEPAELDRP